MARYELQIEYLLPSDRFKAVVRPAWADSPGPAKFQDRLEIVTLEATNDADAMAQVTARVNARCGSDRRDLVGLSRVSEARIQEAPPKELGTMETLNTTVEPTVVDTPTVEPVKGKRAEKAGHKHHCPVAGGHKWDCPTCDAPGASTRVCPEHDAVNPYKTGEVPPMVTPAPKWRPLAVAPSTPQAKAEKAPVVFPSIPPVIPPTPDCLVPGCPRPEDLRGLCARCYTHASQLVRDGLTTWEKLEAEGKARPKAKPAPSDLPHRQAWFLGEWAPDWKAWEAQKALTMTVAPAAPATPAKPKRVRKPRPTKKTAKATA
jgi:hypothetical protein